MTKKLLAGPTQKELEKFFYTGQLEIGDIVRSSPKASLNYPYAGGLHDDKPYFGRVIAYKSAGRDSEGWEYINPQIQSFDGTIIHRHYYWWVVVNSKELEWLRNKYGNFDCKRIRVTHLEDYDPLLEEINKPIAKRRLESLWAKLSGKSTTHSFISGK